MSAPRKMTPEQRAEARRLYESTADEPEKVVRTETNPDRWSYRKLAERFGVSTETIRRALTEETEEGQE